MQGTLTLQNAAVLGGTVTNSGTIESAVGAWGWLGGDVTNTGTIAVSNNSGLHLIGGSTYTNEGLITLNATGPVGSILALDGGGTVTLGGTGALTMTDAPGNAVGVGLAGMTLVNAAGHTITGAGHVGGMGPGAFTFQNDGTVAARGGTGLLVMPSTTFQNNGRFVVDAGSYAEILGSFGNFTDHTFAGGTYGVAGPLRFTGADIVMNAADITLDGPGAGIIDEADHNALRNLSTNSGRFTMVNGASLPALGNLTNTGAVNIGSATTLTTAGYHQTAGATLVNGILVAPTFRLDGGTLGGSGTIDGSIITGGNVFLSPGSSPGLLTIHGDYTQDPLSLLQMELGGLTRGDEYDVARRDRHDEPGRHAGRGALRQFPAGGRQQLRPPGLGHPQRRIRNSQSADFGRRPVLGSIRTLYQRCPERLFVRPADHSRAWLALPLVLFGLTLVTGWRRRHA